jgi:hypothetical protein
VNGPCRRPVLIAIWICFGSVPIRAETTIERASVVMRKPCSWATSSAATVCSVVCMDLRVGDVTQAEALRARQREVDARRRNVADAVLFERGFMRDDGLWPEHGRDLDEPIFERSRVVRESVQTLSDTKKFALAGCVKQRRPPEPSLHGLGRCKQPPTSLCKLEESASVRSAVRYCHAFILLYRNKAMSKMLDVASGD